MTSRPKDPKTARNKNILVIGGSGSGKTRFFVKPSIMQMHSSYVITDPKGQLLKETGKMLLHGAPKLDENGKPVRDSRGKVIYEPYRIKVLNTINFSKSMGLLSPKLTTGTRQAWQRRQGFYRYLNVAALPCSIIPTPPDDEQSPGIFHLQEDFE